MATRTVTGLILKADGAPWADAVIRFRLKEFTYTTTDTHPISTATATTDANGAFSVELSAGLPTRYTVSLPDGNIVEITVPEGDPVSLETLLMAAAIPPNPPNLLTLIEAAIANAFANDVDISGVLTALSLTVLGSAGIATVVNESGVDSDFRVEGVGLPNLLFVDALNGRLGINTDIPAARVELVTLSGIPFMMSAYGAGNPRQDLRRSRSATPGSFSALLDQDIVGEIRFVGDDGTQFTNMVRFTAKADGAPVTGNAAGMFTIETVTQGGGNTLSERFRLRHNGVIENRAGSTIHNQLSPVAGTPNVVNEQGADIDTRIEGDTDQNLLFVDASTDRVGIGTNTPAAKFDINGSLAASGSVSLPGLTRSKEIVFLAGSGTDQWANMPTAETEFFGLTVHRQPVDLAEYTWVRLFSNLRVAGAAGSKIYLQYAASSGGVYVSIGTVAVENALTLVGISDSGWIALASGAKADGIWLKLLGSGGDGVIDPNWGICKAMFK